MVIRPQKIIIICILICLCSKVGFLYGQVGVDSAVLKSQLVEAQDLMDRFQNESAIEILEALEFELNEQGVLSSDFGYKVRDKFAEALEREDRDEEAINILIRLSEETKNKELWNVYANSQLSLARLHEKLGRKENCIKHLRLAANVIEDYEITEYYPRYTVRISSYHRLFGDRDSSIYYANEALRSSRALGLDNQVGTGHLLLGLLKFEENYKEAVVHFETAGEIWYKQGDYSGYSYMHHNLSRLHYDNDRMDLAKLHNDSTFIAAQLTKKLGHDHRPILLSAYHFRSRLHEEGGRLDSALYNSKLAYQLELDLAYSNNSEKIIEIDAKYNDELKSQTIKDQQELLASESKRKDLLRILFFVFLLFSAMLGFFSYRLLSAIKRIRKQSKTIRKTNQDLSKSLSHSKVLQSELHHRVKNNLQVILGLLELQSKDIDDSFAKDKLDGIKQRIHGMAATHAAFNAEAKGDTEVGIFLSSIIDNFKSLAEVDYPIEIFQNVEDFELNMETLMPLGMIINELLTNSVKHFSDANVELTINIDLSRDENYISLMYRDNGPGFQSGSMEKREGRLGNYLINSMVRQLSGHWETSNDGGAMVKMFIKEKHKS